MAPPAVEEEEEEPPLSALSAVKLHFLELMSEDELAGDSDVIGRSRAAGWS